MDLSRIRFRNYKSIKEWVDLKFNNNIIVAVGKNGAGKTNMLEALTIIFKDINFEDIETNIEYQVFFTLNKEEFTNLFPGFDYSDENSLILVTNEHIDSRIVRLRDKKYSMYKEHVISASTDYLDKIKKELRIYKEAILEFQDMRDKYNKDGFKHETVVSRYKVNNSTQETRQKLNEIERILALDIVENEQTHGVDITNDYSYFSLNAAKYNRVEIKPKKLDHTQASNEHFAKTYQEQVNKEIEYFNRRYNKLNQFIEDTRTRLDAKLKQLYDVIQSSSEKIISNHNTLVSFRDHFKEMFKRNIFFLNVKFSMSGDTNPDTEDKTLRNEKEASKFLESIAPLCFNGKKLEKVYDLLNNYYTFSTQKHLVPEIAFAFEKFINAQVPEYEKDMFDKIVVKEENNSLELFIREKTGAFTNLNHTNTGRKLYFYYNFYKSLLKPGDILIIDEPGVYFHPEAQRDLYKTLMSTALDDGIGVIYSTHSPYLINKEIKIIHKLGMTEKGTRVKQIHTNNELFEKYLNNLTEFTTTIFE